MLKRVGTAALVIYGLALAGALVAPRPVTTPRGAPGTRDASDALQTSRPAIGFAINFHHTEHLDLYLQAIDDLAALGFNAVELVTPCYQSNGASDEIGLVVRRGHSPPRADLVTLLEHARGRGLTTVLMPVVLFETPRGNEWRGKIEPEDWGRWWQSYEQMLSYFVDIANETDTGILSVGSELLSTERQVDRWTALIARVRARFHGRLLYSTNWDHFHVPSLWEHLDLIGISAYWDMTTLAEGDRPTDDQLARRWAQLRRKVLDFSAAQKRPVLITELGYPSLPWGLKDPWNYVAGDDVKADPNPQARGYEAFLAAWGDLLEPDRAPTAFEGVVFYAWDPYREGGDRDTGYGVRGKPAFDVLKSWLRKRR